MTIKKLEKFLMWEKDFNETLTINPPSNSIVFILYFAKVFNRIRRHFSKRIQGMNGIDMGDITRNIYLKSRYMCHIFKTM